MTPTLKELAAIATHPVTTSTETRAAYLKALQDSIGMVIKIVNRPKRTRTEVILLKNKENKK